MSPLLSDARILAGYLIFFGSYVVFALGKFPGMKIDRPGAAIIGAVLMVAFRRCASRPWRSSGLAMNWWVIHWIFLRETIDRVPVAEALTLPELRHGDLRKKPVMAMADSVRGASSCSGAGHRFAPRLVALRSVSTSRQAG